jgi:hypothetical protein
MQRILNKLFRVLDPSYGDAQFQQEYRGVVCILPARIST